MLPKQLSSDPALEQMEFQTTPVSRPNPQQIQLIGQGEDPAPSIMTLGSFASAEEPSKNNQNEEKAESIAALQ